MLEVSYMMSDYLMIFKLLEKKLKPDGKIIMSVRSRYYYALLLLKIGLIDSSSITINNNHGDILGTGINLNWTDSNELQIRLLRDYNLKVENIFGIGTCSGIAQDPFDTIMQPSSLSVKEQEKLYEIEDHFGNKYPDSGRYILFSAVKSP